MQSESMVHDAINHLEHFSGDGDTLFFAHANGYPVGSYRQLLQALTSCCSVVGMNQRPIWDQSPAPKRLDWQQLSEDLLDTVHATQSEPVWLMGHSMGAVVATLAAASEPEAFRGLVLIDPVFFMPESIPERQAQSDAVLDTMPLVARTLTRPERFDDPQSAFTFYRGKRSFQDFSDSVLMDYSRASLTPAEEGGYRLRYPRAWEAAAYRSAPAVWDALRAISLPVLGLRGETSDVLMPEVFELWGETQPQAALETLTGGHLLPLEYSAETAVRIKQFLKQDRTPLDQHEAG
ncbi:MAG: alpha/beta hydrolase [Pseudomonadota bacterium]